MARSRSPSGVVHRRRLEQRLHLRLAQRARQLAPELRGQEVHRRIVGALSGLGEVGEEAPHRHQGARDRARREAAAPQVAQVRGDGVLIGGQEIGVRLLVERRSQPHQVAAVGGDGVGREPALDRQRLEVALDRAAPRALGGPALLGHVRSRAAAARRPASGRSGRPRRRSARGPRPWRARRWRRPAPAPRPTPCSRSQYSTLDLPLIGPISICWRRPTMLAGTPE